MKRPLFDTNVVIDVLLLRPGYEDTAALWEQVEARQLMGFLPAHAVTTIFYVLRKSQGVDFAYRGVAALLGVFRVAAVDEAVLTSALSANWPDFEDAVCAFAALTAGCDAVVTRNPTDFRKCELPVLAPSAALERSQSS